MNMTFQKSFRKPFQILFICGFFLLLNSCEFIKREKLLLTVKQEYGKVLDFSWSGSQILVDTVITHFEIQKPITIVSYIDKQLCPECFAKYLKGAEKYINLFHSDDVQFVCIVYPRPVEDLQYALTLSDTDPQKVMIIYDSNNQYLTVNSIVKLSDGFNVFLIDKDHKIALLGDPIRSEAMYDLCKKTVISMLDELQ